MLQQFMAPAVFLIFTVGFALIWNANRHITAAGIWAVGYFLGFLSFSMSPLLNAFPEWRFLRPIGDTAYLGSCVLLVIGLGIRYGVKVLAIPVGMVFMVSVTVISWYWFVVDNYSIRTEAISYGCGALLIIGAWMIYPTLKSQRTHILFWIVSAFAAQAFLTPITTIYVLGERFTEATVSGSFYVELLSLTVSLTAICLATALLVDVGMNIVHRLRDEAATDGMTGLRTRQSFEATVMAAYGTSEKDVRPAALIVCDIDNFKAVNDTFGHGVGDEVICGFADVLRDGCRSEDYAARYGGEEFIVFLPRTTLQMARLVAEQLRMGFERYRCSEPVEDQTFSASFGVAVFREGELYDSVFARADAALYAAKHSGRNCVRMCEEDAACEDTGGQRAPV